MADYPLDELGQRTPLQVADTPNMDELAKKGKCGRLITIPESIFRAEEFWRQLVWVLNWVRRMWLSGAIPFA